jgi:pyridinium-3,5-bisthiocarboxylic acid mononucleotide nickel chelatase
VLPVPAPATARLLQDKPIYARGPALELTTPTGAAVVSALAESFGAMPALRVRSIGYGAGDRDFKEHANVVRVMVGEPSGASELTTVTVIEANIDDASPQLIGYAMESMIEAGALDAVVVPAQMKKGRPGVMIQVIAGNDKREELADILFRETTTLGIRFHTVERRVQSREWIPVQTPYGVVRVKAGDQGFAPEYEDARQIASVSGVPLKQILAEAAYAYLKQKR